MSDTSYIKYPSETGVFHFAVDGDLFHWKTLCGRQPHIHDVEKVMGLPLEQPVWVRYPKKTNRSATGVCKNCLRNTL